MFMDEKTKERKDELINLVSGFCDEKLDREYKTLCLKLVEKLSRKREVPFRRGKIEIWAGGIVYAIGQINFLFDDSFKPYAAPDDICKYFKTNKSSTSNKARDIRKLLNIKVGDREFSTRRLLNSNVRGGDMSQMKSLQGAENMATIMNTVEILKLFGRRRR